MTTLSAKQNKRLRAVYQAGAANFNEEKLNNLLNKGNSVMRKGRLLGGFLGQFSLLWSLLQDYRAGNYTAVPWKMIAAVGFSIVYLLTPLDVIPDFLPVAGLLDDTAVLGFVLAAFRSELAAYEEWRSLRDKPENEVPAHEVGEQ